MEWIKVVGAVLVILSCTGIGDCQVQKIKERKREFEVLVFCILRLKSEIGKEKKPLPEALLASAGKNERRSAVKQLICSFARRLKEGTHGFEEALMLSEREFQKKGVFSVEETSRFVEIFRSLGGPDRDKQAEILTIYQEELRGQLQEEKKKKKEKSYLYRTLGFLCGIFLTILLI